MTVSFVAQNSWGTAESLAVATQLVCLGDSGPRALVADDGDGSVLLLTGGLLLPERVALQALSAG